MKRLSIKVDWWLIAPAIVLVVLGLTTLSAIQFSLFQTQLANAILCFVVFLLFSQLTIDSVRSFYVPIYIIALFILGVGFFIGFESHGAVRWIEIFGVSIQFSELLKPFLALSLAGYLSQKDAPTIKTFFSVLLFITPLFGLIYFQPDLGNAMIYLIVTILVLFIYGFPILWFGISFVPFVLLSPFLWNSLRDYQKQRILTFLHPVDDPLGVSYNAIQSMIAVGAGMIFGRGISEGTQSGLRFLPERHTDFIFATYTESFGFVGATLMLVCFFFLCLEVYKIFSHSDNLFHRIFAASAFCLFLTQMVVNVGMNVGIVPIVGVTLPFVSFGGSSLLSNFIFLGILNAMKLSQKQRTVLRVP